MPFFLQKVESKSCSSIIKFKKVGMLAYLPIFSCISHEHVESYVQFFYRQYRTQQMINMGMSTSSATPITTTAAIAPGGQSVKKK